MDKSIVGVGMTCCSKAALNELLISVIARNDSIRRYLVKMLTIINI